MLKAAAPQDRIRTVPSERVFQVLRDLRIAPAADFDRGTLRRLAEFTNASTLVFGQYVKAGGQLRLEAVVRDLERGVSESVSTLADQQQLMDAVVALSRGVDEKLMSGSPAAAPAATAAPSTRSVEALRLFSEGSELRRRGNHLEPLKKFQAAVRADPQFALAHARLAESYAYVGHDGDHAHFVANLASAVSMYDGLVVSVIVISQWALEAKPTRLKS